MGNCRKVYFTGPRAVECREESRPTPGAGELLIETRYSAISSGTELLIYRGQQPEDMVSDTTISALDGTLDYPVAFGYAVVGRVRAAGEHVSDAWIGRRVFAFHPHATHAVASPDEVIPIPDDCSWQDAALFPSMETAVNFALDGRPMIGERVMVLGQGIVGLLTTAVLSGFPLEALVTVERVALRRDLSRAFGASEALRPGDLPSGRGEESADRGHGAAPVDLAYELSGNPEAVNTAIRVAGYGARIVLGSWYGRKRADLDLGGDFHRSRLQLTSSQVSTIDPALRGRWDKARRGDVAWSLLTDHQPASSVVTHTLPAEEAGEAYRLLDRHFDRAVQVLLSYGSRPPD